MVPVVVVLVSAAVVGSVDATGPFFGLAATVIAAIGLGYAVSYRRFVRQRHAIEDAWADVDAELGRRHRLVADLVEVVRPTTDDERALVDELARRNDAASAADHTVIAAKTCEPPLTGAVRDVIARRHPEGDEEARRVRAELDTTDELIAAARRRYNTCVEHLNRRVDAFPSGLVASRHGFTKAELFDV